ncbi:MAG: DegT/DnrJ/EryC1/StrS family aminotransferase [Gemmatimonadota bacterium]
MPVPLLDLQRQYTTIKDEIDREVLRVVAAQRFILGPDVEAFEQQIAAYTGSSHAIGCASGTDAILLALKALPLDPGAEVVTPAFTFFATAGAIWNAGLEPVFCDIDPQTFNVTAETVSAALTPRTKAIVVVHLYGHMARMAELMELARERNLFVIEDAAQSLGARQHINGNERQSGTVGHIGTYSFFPSKNLGAFGDAGLMVTDDDAFAEKLRKLRVHGGRQMYHHEMVGTNSRLDALQAAVLSAKLPHLDRWAGARRANAAEYDSAFADCSAFVTPVELDGNYHVFNQYTLRVRERDRLKQQLDAAGIGNAIYYPLPLHLQECFASLGYGRGDLPISEQLASEVISIPVFPELTAAEKSQVVEAILNFYESKDRDICG